MNPVGRRQVDVIVALVHSISVHMVHTGKPQVDLQCLSLRPNRTAQFTSPAELHSIDS